ncbi:MAG: hypothetical protein HY820_05020 [Acidobacteria bacterium]|nr:hypothetical protein [Acidobacteriota bacterium]
MQTLKLIPFALLATGLIAQSPVIVENDQVRVLKVTAQPNNKTRLHEHKMNRVMVYLQPGEQNTDYQDGRRVVTNWKAGEALWSPSGGMHIAEIFSAGPVTIAEIELKNKGTSTKAGASPLDPVSVDPKHYKVEMENDQVRVLRVKIGAKESVPSHEHVLNRVVVYITDQEFKVTSTDGKVDLPKHKAGDVVFSGAAKHKEENTASEPFEVLVVELK